MPCWAFFYLHSCINSSWYRFSKVLDAFFRDFASNRCNSITQLTKNSLRVQCDYKRRHCQLWYLNNAQVLNVRI